VPVEKREPARYNFTHFAGGIAAGPLEEFRRYGVGVLVARLANKVNKQLDGASPSS
jgi:hypothetical protein